MDESALRTLIANLDASGSLFHWWLNVSTFLVVVGVVLELVFVVVEYREELHQFKRGIMRPPDRPGRLLFFSGLLVLRWLHLVFLESYMREPRLNNWKRGYESQ